MRLLPSLSHFSEFLNFLLYFFFLYIFNFFLVNAKCGDSDLRWTESISSVQRANQYTDLVVTVFFPLLIFFCFFHIHFASLINIKKCCYYTSCFIWCDVQSFSIHTQFSIGKEFFFLRLLLNCFKYQIWFSFSFDLIIFICLIRFSHSLFWFWVFMVSNLFIF